MKNLNIICFAGNLYDQKPWTNRQHIMVRLAERGYCVVYIEPPKSIFRQLVKLIFRMKSEQKVFKWFERILKLERREENLCLFSLIEVVLIKYRSLRKLNYLLCCHFLKRKLRQTGMENSILWIYTPDAVVLAGRLGEKLLCYDCVDNYASQPWYQKNLKDIDKDELELLKKADLVFTSSKNLYEDKRKYNSQTYLVHNVGDYNHFIKATYPETKIPKDIENIPSPIIGFIGAIDDYKLDMELVSYLAQERTDWSIVLIGPTGIAGKKMCTSVLKNYKNVYLLGEKEYEILPNYIKTFDVCIIPYRNNEYTRNCFPIKFFEYLATGKPVVVIGLPELEKFAHLTEVAKDKGEFIRSISECLKYDAPEKRQKRIELARENTWEKKAQKQIEIIISHLYNKNNENRN